MVRRRCKHRPIPGCGSKFLVRLADHLIRVHELSGIERKYCLQFAKLQNINVVRVYEKEAEPKTIFLLIRVRTIHLISCDRGPEMETSFPRACGRPNMLWEKSVCKTLT